MNGWIEDGWTDGWMDRQMDGQMTDAQMDGETMNGEVDGWRDDRQMIERKQMLKSANSTQHQRSPQKGNIAS